MKNRRLDRHLSSVWRQNVSVQSDKLGRAHDQHRHILNSMIYTNIVYIYWQLKGVRWRGNRCSYFQNDGTYQRKDVYGEKVTSGYNHLNSSDVQVNKLDYTLGQVHLDMLKSLGQSTQ